MGESKVIQTIGLASLEGGKIILTRMEHPYGETSHPVVGIAVSLNGEEANWTVHIPYENIDELITALQAAKNTQ